jgi:hypothetical protein
VAKVQKMQQLWPKDSFTNKKNKPEIGVSDFHLQQNQASI